MVEKIKLSIAKFLFPKLYERYRYDQQACFDASRQWEEKIRAIDDEVNQRVAATLMKMDPFEPLLQKYKGTFGKDYTRPEEKLNPQSQMQMFMWGHAQVSDPSFKHFIQWILDTEGNKMVRMSNPNPETILFSRAMIAAPMLMRREVERLSGRYEEMMLALKEGRDFDPTVAVE